MTSEYRAQYDAGYDPELKYNPNGLENPTPVTRIIGGGVRGIAAGIGLVSEGVRELNDRRKLKSRKDVPSSPGSSANTSDADLVKETLNEEGVDGASEQFDDGEDEDANGWHQDSESAKTGHEESLGRDLSPTKTGDATEQSMSEIHSTEKTPDSIQPVVSPRSGKLPYPVILPQRRPGTKSRGFVRAYAPILQSVDITQETFLSFLKQLHKNSQASPVFDVVIIAANIGAFYPNYIAATTSTAVLIAAKAGQEMQERWRMNKFLNLANKELFMPKGLFAFVATYKPIPADISSSVTSGTYDMAAEAMVKYGDSFPAESEQDQSKTEGLKGKWQRLRLDSGQTFGEGQMPVTCAPLIFPGTDISTPSTSPAFPLTPESAPGVSTSSGEKRPTPLRHKSSKKFVQDYFDRRAQATYVSFCSGLLDTISADVNATGTLSP